MSIRGRAAKRWVWELLDRAGQGRFELRLPDWASNSGVIAEGAHEVAAIEFGMRTDKLIRGALFDLLAAPQPVSVLVWPSGPDGSRYDPARIPAWISELERRLGVPAGRGADRLAVLSDDMQDDNPEVHRLFTLLRFAGGLGPHSDERTGAG